MTPITLALTTSRGDRTLAQTTREMAQRLNNTGIRTKFVEPDDRGPPGARGDEFSLGQLAIDLVTSGAVTALLECLKAFLERDNSLRIKIDILGLEITSQNIDSEKTKSKLESTQPKD